MNSEDMLKLFEEVASVYQNEGAEALTEERIDELCQKHDISATELEDLCKNVPCSGEEKISIDDDILENIAGGKMDLKRGAATLLAALSAASPLSSNASASEPKNVRPKITNNAEADHVSKKAPDPDTVSCVQNRFGISKKTAKWMVSAAALLSAYPIAKVVKGLIPNESANIEEHSISQNGSDPLSGGLDSNEFKKHLESYGAIRLDDSNCNSLDDLKNSLKTCNKREYKTEKYHSMLIVSQDETDRKANSFYRVCIGYDKASVGKLNNILKRDLSCTASNYNEKEFMQNDEIGKLLKEKTVPVIVVNGNVMRDIICPLCDMKLNGDDGEGMFDCAPDILDAFNAKRDIPKCD